MTYFIMYSCGCWLISTVRIVVMRVFYGGVVRRLIGGHNVVATWLGTGAHMCLADGLSHGGAAPLSGETLVDAGHRRATGQETPGQHI
jgi:hypothetical protein